VASGETLVVLDHRRAIAHVVPVPEGLPLARRATGAYVCRELEALVSRESLVHLDEERAERW
jgi:antitoxin (DNA-binding transcriptional repressor) of toxin-antitoxin stability system